MHRVFQNFNDISPDFRPNKKDRQTVKKIFPHWETPEAIKVFSRYEYRLSDYAYWYVLSTLWVSYTGGSNLDEWKRLFGSSRPGRDSGIMKPGELDIFKRLEDPLTLYRAHRPGETDWISYSLFMENAAVFAAKRGVFHVSAYLVKKSDVLCLFLRRGEFEVLVLDKSKAEFLYKRPVTGREFIDV